jgi:hypothetical protein
MQDTDFQGLGGYRESLELCRKAPLRTALFLSAQNHLSLPLLVGCNRCDRLLRRCARRVRRQFFIHLGG